MTNAEDHKQSFGDSINASLGDNAKNVIVGKDDQINTGGGAAIQGDANITDGDLVGRDKYEDNSVTTINHNGSIAKLVDTVCGALGIDAIRKVLNAWADGKVMRIQAQANADAKIISLKSEMEVREMDLRKKLDLDMWHRAMNRFEKVELRRQSNREGITLKAFSFLPPSASSEPVNEDWVFAFYEDSQDISDEQMQEVWARILASEVGKPGSFSKRTLQAVKVLSVTEAQLFARCCAFTWNGEDKEDRVFPIINLENEITFPFAPEVNSNSLHILQAAGLLTIAQYRIVHPRNLYHLRYFDSHYLLTLPLEINTFYFSTGQAMFTETGKELSQMVKPEPNREYEQSVIDRWQNEEGVMVEKL